jgi:ribosomal protein L37E
MAESPPESEKFARSDWLRVDGIWHEWSSASERTRCGRGRPADGKLSKKLSSASVRCPRCQEIARQLQDAQGAFKKKATVPTCKRCHQNRRVAKLSLCKSCAHLAGYRKCSRCKGLFLPKNSRHKMCKRCGEESKSIRTVSGGLPGLGKR